MDPLQWNMVSPAPVSRRSPEFLAMLRKRAAMNNLGGLSDPPIALGQPGEPFGTVGQLGRGWSPPNDLGGLNEPPIEMPPSGMSVDDLLRSLAKPTESFGQTISNTIPHGSGAGTLWEAPPEIGSGSQILQDLIGLGKSDAGPALGAIGSKLTPFLTAMEQYAPTLFKGGKLLGRAAGPLAVGLGALDSGTWLKRLSSGQATPEDYRRLQSRDQQRLGMLGDIPLVGPLANMGANVIADTANTVSDEWNGRGGGNAFEGALKIAGAPFQSAFDQAGMGISGMAGGPDEAGYQAMLKANPDSIAGSLWDWHQAHPGMARNPVTGEKTAATSPHGMSASSTPSRSVLGEAPNQPSDPFSGVKAGDTRGLMDVIRQRAAKLKQENAGAWGGGGDDYIHNTPTFDTRTRNLDTVGTELFRHLGSKDMTGANALLQKALGMDP